MADLDSPKLAEIVSGFDAVLHTAHADHLAGAEALISGLEKRAETSNRKPILIHTSGTGVLVDPAEPLGSYKSKKIYSDEDLSPYHALPDTRYHKNVDNIVLDAGRRGKIDVVIVAPPTIWGTGQGEFNAHSIQVPRLIKMYLEFGRGLVLEDGLNTWNIIHVADLSQAFLIILDAAANGRLPPNPDGRYFFVENGEYEQRQVAEAATRTLYEKGKVEAPEPTRVPITDIDKYNRGAGRVLFVMSGSNSRCRAVLLRKLYGWEARKGGIDEFLGSIKDEVDYVLKS